MTEREEKLKETLRWALDYMPFFEAEENRQKVKDARALLTEMQPAPDFPMCGVDSPQERAEIATRQPAPPSLSAEQVREVFATGKVPITAGLVYWQDKADRLNALLGAAKPAKPGIDWVTQNKLAQAAEKKDCEKALLALAGWYPTPVEGYGFNVSWAISDLCRAVTELRKREAEGQEGDGR